MIQCHLSLDNIENDLESLSTAGTSQIYTQEQFTELLAQSKAIADTFNQIQIGLSSGDALMLQQAMAKLN